MIPELHTEPGWIGVFTREQALGCYRNGTRVVKVTSEPGDGHPIGAKATVIGSIAHAVVGAAYFVEWDEDPRVAILVVAAKLRAVPP